MKNYIVPGFILSLLLLTIFSIGTVQAYKLRKTPQFREIVVQEEFNYTQLKDSLVTPPNARYFRNITIRKEYRGNKLFFYHTTVDTVSIGPMVYEKK